MRNQCVTVLVDVNNLFHGAMKSHNGRVDYAKLFGEFGSHGQLRTAFAFGTGTDNAETESFRAFLRHAGYECRWAIGRYNWNVGLAMEVVRQVQKSDLIIIGSGDPFLAPCADWIRQQGVKCYVYGFSISNEMRKAADRFFEIPESLLLNADATVT